MDRLTLFDQIFYKLEAGGVSPLYMGGAAIIDTTGSPYPLDAEAVASHLAARLEQIPVLRKKLVQDKLRIGDMRLVDAPDFNVNNHITRAALPAPGDYDQLTGYMAEFSVRRMDLTRPLWHCEVIDGLENGRIAIAIHLHHAIFDGVGAQQVLSSMWSQEPVPPEKPSDKAWQVEDEPTPFELQRDAVLENLERVCIKTPKALLKNGRPALKAALSAIKGRIEKSAADTDDKPLAPKAKKTSLNGRGLSSKRAVSYVELPMDEVKALRAALNCKINDLTLLLNSCALEHYFREIGEELDFDLVCIMPVSIRKPGDEGGGNAVTAARINLHNQVPDLAKRLDAIASGTEAVKRAQQDKVENAGPGVDGGEIMGLVSPIVLDVAVYGAVKANLMSRAPLPANLIISNVPGAQAPMYFSGAKEVGSVPMAPVNDMMGVTGTITSVAGKLIIGFHGCGEVVKDKELFTEGVRMAFDELKKAVSKSASAPVGKRSAARGKAPARKKTPAQKKVSVKQKAAPKKAAPKKR